MGLRETLFGVRKQDDVEERSSLVMSMNALADFLGLTDSPWSQVTEHRALGLPAYYRAVSVLAGAIATLPLKTYRELPNGQRTRVKSFLDNPAGPYPLTSYAWKEMVMLHLLNNGEAFLLHTRNGAGAIVGLWPVHPSSVEVEWRDSTSKQFTVTYDDGSKRVYGPEDMTHIMAITLDGQRGIAPITVFRRTIQLGLAGEIAAHRTMNNGMLISGLVTPDQDMTEEEAKAIKDGLKAKIAGAEHAGDIAVVNRNLKFTPWSMTAEDAQFLESREFQVIEFARMFGIPPHLLGATEKQTSWGTGVAEQNLSLQKFTLMPWTSRIEEALTELLPSSRYCEFDYHGLLQGTPAQEIEILIQQVQAGLLTNPEARAILNLPPLPEGEANGQSTDRVS